ncbi:MAG: hypothetical protein ACRDQD_07510 [Nocardioidaceae bacterium]
MSAGCSRSPALSGDDDGAAHVENASVAPTHGHDRRGDLHVLPCLLGDGTRLYEVADGSVRKLQNLGGDPNAATNVRFRAS